MPNCLNKDLCFLCCFLLADSIYGICRERRENLNIRVSRNYSWSKLLPRKPANLWQPAATQFHDQWPFPGTERPVIHECQCAHNHNCAQCKSPDVHPRLNRNKINVRRQSNRCLSVGSWWLSWDPILRRDSEKDCCLEFQKQQQLSLIHISEPTRPN